MRLAARSIVVAIVLVLAAQLGVAAQSDITIINETGSQVMLDIRATTAKGGNVSTRFLSNGESLQASASTYLISVKTSVPIGSFAPVLRCSKRDPKPGTYKITKRSSDTCSIS